MKVFGPPTTKWRPCEFFVKLNGNHLWMANIFKLHKYQKFALMKMQNRAKSDLPIINSVYEKVWFTNNRPFIFFQILNDYCQKSYGITILFHSGFWMVFEVLLRHESLWSTNFWQWNDSSFKTFWSLHWNAFCFFIFSKWKKYYNLTFDDTFKMYCCWLC